MTIFLDAPPLGYDRPPIGNAGLTVHYCEMKSGVWHFLLFDFDGFICSTDDPADLERLFREQVQNSTGTSPNAEKLYYWRSGAREFVRPGSADELQRARANRATSMKALLPRGKTPAEVKAEKKSISLEDLGLA